MNTLLLPLSNFNGSELDNHLEYIRKTRNNSKHYMTRFRGEINSEMQKSWYSNISKKINPYIFIVEEHGVVFYPVGYGTINIEGDSAMVTGVISQSERGKGFGRKLFSALIEESKKMAQKVSLEVLENNTIGISLYESIGFIETNRDHDVITMELKKMIPQFKVKMALDAKEIVAEVLDSGFIGQGPRVEEFEDILWKELGSSVRPVTVNSCTSAIDLALDLIGVGPGDEVISTPQTCFASQVGAIHKGATIRWADIDPITGCMDSNSIERLITDKTKAIIAVNWAGRYCNFTSLKSFGIPVVEDAAHCWDVFNDNTCERGDYICYSFQAIKFLTTGDGGILIPPKDKEEDARLLRWYGLDRTKGQSFRCTQNIKEAGFKYQMNDIAAAIGIKNIPHAKESVFDHRKNSKIFIDRIRNNDIVIPEWDENGSYWIFSLHVINGRRNEFLEYMKNISITVSPVHYRNDEYDCTIEFREFDLPGVNQFSDTQVCIPNGWWLTEDELDYIVEKINEF